MNPRRFRSSRPDSGSSAGRPAAGRGGRRSPADLPTLLGEPSPSLAKILRMRSSELAAKIDSLTEEQTQLTARLVRLARLDPQPVDKIKTVEALLRRLEALEAAARRRLAERQAPV